MSSVKRRSSMRRFPRSILSAPCGRFQSYAPPNGCSSVLALEWTHSRTLCRARSSPACCRLKSRTYRLHAGAMSRAVSAATVCLLHPGTPALAQNNKTPDLTPAQLFQTPESPPCPAQADAPSTAHTSINRRLYQSTASMAVIQKSRQSQSTQRATATRQRAFCNHQNCIRGLFSLSGVHMHLCNALCANMFSRQRQMAG